MKKGQVTTTISALSDPGIKNQGNSDNYLLIDLSTGQSLPDQAVVEQTIEENRLLFGVSDGVGNTQYSTLASEVTLLYIRDALLQMGQEIATSDRLTIAIEQANEQLYQENRRQNLQQMK